MYVFSSYCHMNFSYYYCWHRGCVGLWPSVNNVRVTLTGVRSCQHVRTELIQRRHRLQHNCFINISVLQY